MTTSERTTPTADSQTHKRESPGRGGRVWTAITSAFATISGLLPHVLHHIGLLAGVAVVSGFAGTVLFGVVGLVASVPFLLRLHRRFRNWRAPAIALVIFAILFSISAFVIGPRIAPTPSKSSNLQETIDHSSHHGPN